MTFAILSIIKCRKIRILILQNGTKDKIILHQAGEKTCKIPVSLREIINIKLKNIRNQISNNYVLSLKNKNLNFIKITNPPNNVSVIRQINK